MNKLCKTQKLITIADCVRKMLVELSSLKRSVSLITVKLNNIIRFNIQYTYI